MHAQKNIMTAFTKDNFFNEAMMASLPGVNNEVDKCAELIYNLLIWARDQLNESNTLFKNPELFNMIENR